MRRPKLFVVAIAVASAGVLSLGGLAVGVHRRAVVDLPAGRPGLVVGSFHVHSDMSHDSTMSIAEIVAAARTDHLDFVVLADHNNQYAGPVVRDGVVVLSYAELSARYGHVIGLGASSVLSRDERRAEDVLGRIRAAGATPVVTHPADPKQPWSGSLADAGGVEIANFASSARRHGGRGFVGLAPVLAAGLLNRRLALAQIYDRDVEALAAWDASPDPGFVGACGVDAHGWIDLGENLLAWTLVTDGPLPADEAARPAWILERLRAGRFWCSAGLLGGPLAMALEARKGVTPLARAGDTVTTGTIDELAVRIPSTTPGMSLVLFRNGMAVQSSDSAELHYRDPAPGTYRVEVWVRVPDLVHGDHVVPAIYSGRLRVAPPPLPGSPGVPAAPAATPVAGTEP